MPTFCTSQDSPGERESSSWTENASSKQVYSAAPEFNSVKMEYSENLWIWLFLYTGNFKIYPAISQIVLGFSLVIPRYLLEIMSSKGLKQIDHGKSTFSYKTAVFELLSDIPGRAMTGDGDCCVNQTTELLNYFCAFIPLFLEEVSLTSRCCFSRSQSVRKHRVAWSCHISTKSISLLLCWCLCPLNEISIDHETHLVCP